MKFLKQNKKVIAISFLIIFALAFTYFFCDKDTESKKDNSVFSENVTDNQDVTSDKTEKSSEKTDTKLSEAKKSQDDTFENEDLQDTTEQDVPKENLKIDTDIPDKKEEPIENTSVTDNSIGNDETYQNSNENTEEKEVSQNTNSAETVNSEKTEDGKSQEKEEEKKSQGEKKYCTLSVNCKTAVGKSSDKEEIIPPDGVILAPQKVEITDGDSVFDILLRELRKRKIHLEFVNTPVFNSTYIEGIGNLYEFDCGDLSGWLYSVNGIFPDYGCSLYFPDDGDEIYWIYTCDLGKDVGAKQISESENLQ